MDIKVIDWSYYTGTVPGYGDCRAVVGEYACLLPDRHVESFLGIAGLPQGQNVNYLRIPRNPGDGRMAGGGQDGAVKDQVLEWQWPAGWVPVGTMFGPNGVIYDWLDLLVAVTTRTQYQQTAGFRYPLDNGTLVDCQSTREDVPAGIYEWSRHGNLRIGQGADGIAVVAFDGEPLRRLDPRPVADRHLPADMRFMHSDQRGDLFGIAICELKGRKTYFVWPTLAELRALPFVTETPVPPSPIPPENTMEMPADVYGVLHDVAVKFEAMHKGTDEERREAMKRGIETVHARIPNSDRWQHKAGGPSNPASKDAAAYIPNGPIADRLQATMFMFDTINGVTREPNPAPLHGESDSQWIVVVGSKDWLLGGGTVPPQPTTHRYQGGGNDTGTCDQCGQPKVSDVHRVPEGKVPHVPWLGEDGVGDCDLCFQPVSAPIHGTTPPPSGDHEARLQVLERWRAEMARISQ